MAFQQMAMNEVVEKQLKSLWRTLENLRQTSVALHGDIKMPVRAYASGLEDRLKAAEEAWEGDPIVTNRVRKIREYMDHYNLVDKGQD